MPWLVDAVPGPSTQSVIGGVVNCPRVARICIPGTQDVLGGMDVAVTVTEAEAGSLRVMLANVGG
jgi:hypothetical protein